MVRLIVVNESALDNPATPPSLNHLITKDIAYQRQGGAWWVARGVVG